MTHLEIRQKFLKFFEERGHKIVPSSSLLPDDPSVLFTTAGMQQFKPYYTGEADPVKDFGLLNTVSIQKSMRTSDIDEVGDESHLTFFEMLGNFSFGGHEPSPAASYGASYWKKEAIQYGYDFIVKELGVPLERVRVSVFRGDSKTPADLESLEIWRSLGFADDKIIFGERKDNFWGPTGNRGPCGPTTEIYVDGVEIWNIVFNEYFCDIHATLTDDPPKKHSDILAAPRSELRSTTGENVRMSSGAHFVPLEKKGIDTGMGLERLAMILQKKNHVFETDLLAPIISEIRGKNLYPVRSRPAEGGAASTLGHSASNGAYDYGKNARAERIIADHLRAAVFLIADGVRPLNVEQGYILRRLLRRAIRYVRLLDLPQDLYERVVHVIAHDIYGEIYPHTKRGQALLGVKGARPRYGVGVYPELAEKQKEILDVIETEKNKFQKTLKVGLEKLEKLAQQKKEREEFGVSGSEAFNLYSTFGFPIELIEELAKEWFLSVDAAGFRKELESHKEKSREGAQKKFGGHGLILDTGELRAGNEKELAKVTRLHTATHLFHAALRKVLGPEVRQAGSDITAERLRFDFTTNRRSTPEELKKIENLVNDIIKQDLPVTKKEMSYEEAVQSGALAFFKLKYPERVNVYTIGPENGQFFSKELCGGPHVTRTGAIGKFKIVKEEAVGSGVRRIRATVE